ncbi:hypothetical protein PVAND_009293 [Polypedilum vanderplanki]|uniref:Uncharacterized protein n=1 Tax=Polypedilum vanderplanki TaxID=319348 RepID=A0A9J6CC68_POLVA|nr:hypothetical protein PVAND_009293 [Polypedilum vanderplanki]
MKILIVLLCFVSTALSQYDGPAPPRINIPGAIPLPVLRPNQQGRAIQGGSPIPVRVRKPARPQPAQEQNFFEAKPVIEESDDEHHFVQSQPAPPSPPRALFTSEPQEADVSSNAQRFNIDRPRPAAPRPQPQQQQQPQRPRAQIFDSERPHQKIHQSDDKPKKPVAQILRKYREEHPDGSITWGFENDDGSFKEETIGIDCITRGVYGYIDPDGEKREYKYETGILCDPDKRDQEEEDLEDEEVLANLKQKAQQRPNQQQQFYRN